MAKTIKFNLICDGKPVRTINDLQESFSVEDVLKYYENGLLMRWLNVRGYKEELKRVEELVCHTPIDTIKELIKIFNVECDDKKIEESVYMLRFLEDRKEDFKEYEKNNFKVKKVIEDYQLEYFRLVYEIINNPNDVAKIKSNISELVTNYKWALDMNHRELFWHLKENNLFLAIMCLLMNDETRKYYLPLYVRDESSDVLLLDTDLILDKGEMYEAICAMIQTSNFDEALGDNLCIFSGVTDSYWKDLESKEKKYLILKMGDGDFVRSAGVQGGDLAFDDIYNKFVILDGIDYKSNSNSRKLVYMEV